MGSKGARVATSRSTELVVMTNIYRQSYMVILTQSRFLFCGYEFTRFY
jgi:hypothetical protein